MADDLKWPVRILLVALHWMLGLVPWILSPVFSLMYEGKKDERTEKPEEALTPVQVEIISAPASVLAHKIRQRELQCVDVVEAFITRIKQVNGHLNAVVAERYNAALEEAANVDRVLDSGDIPAAWQDASLLGIPFTAKEAFAIVGMPNSSGLKSRQKLKCEFDADVIVELRKSGAIPLAVTNCSELCMWYESSNLLYGRTNNAYHHGRIVGGSSGGEGCILSAAGSVIGVGSDIGGSIRMPAFFNGIFGHKPSRGIVSNTGQYPNAENEAQSFLSTGPMCRFACDLAPMLKVMAGPGGVDQLRLDDKVDLHKVKFYYMEDDGGSFFVSPVNDQIKKTIHRAIAHFEGSFQGVIGQEAKLKKLKLSLPIWMMKMSSSNNTPFCTLMGGGDAPVNPLKELLFWLLQFPRHTLPAIGLGLLEKSAPNRDFVQYMRQKCDELRQDVQELLGADGVLLYPTHPLPAPYHNQPLTVINNFSYTGIFNTLGFPVTAVPMGLAQEGVPIGIQVVASHLNDRLCLAVAQELENAFGGWVPPY